MTGSRACHVALLRGINVGGKNKLPMKGLVELFGAAGCTDVRTYIQSGNVVFRASAQVLEGLPSAIPRAIEERFELDVPVVLRSAVELAAVLRSNPFAKAGAGEEHLHVVFLREQPSAARVKALDPARSPGDELRVRGREVYPWLPTGVARTKLTVPWLDAEFATTATQRNWRTVRALVALANE